MPFSFLCFDFFFMHKISTRLILNRNYSQYCRVAPELFSVIGHPNATNWNLEQGYNDGHGGESSLDFYPNRVFSTGHLNGLTILLYLDPENLDYLCQGPVQGFKVVLHAPAEIPLPSKVPKKIKEKSEC